jgi:transcriptional regulator with XRE-family HTH domain
MNPPRSLAAARFDVLLFVRPKLLASFYGFHASTVSRWRRGLILPDAESRETIRAATGIPAADWDTPESDKFCPICGVFTEEINAHGC